MFERVYPARRPPSPVLSGSVVASILVHAAGFAAAGISLPVYVNEQVTDGMLYFAPVPVQRPESPSQRLTYVDVPGRGTGDASIGAPEAFGDGLAPVRGQSGSEPDEADGMEGIAALAAVPQVNLDSVYFPDEVDNPAAYDPRSAAPAYPDSLQSAGVEGSVTAQFIVDTTGRAALASLEIVSATDRRFAESVREALPGMLFRPAELGGMKTRQLVQQTYTFRIPARQKAGGDATAPPTQSVPTPPPRPAD